MNFEGIGELSHVKLGELSQIPFFEGNLKSKGLGVLGPMCSTKRLVYLIFRRSTCVCVCVCFANTVSLTFGMPSWMT